MNPYDWQSHNPQVEVLRPALAKVTKTLGRGGSAVILGGRGMGKSVFLQQVCASLEREDGIQIIIIPAPPPELTVRACLDQLSRRLGASEGAFNSREILDDYFARDDAPERLVLLFDEFDRFVSVGDAGGEHVAGGAGLGFSQALCLLLLSVSQQFDDLVNDRRPRVAKREYLNQFEDCGQGCDQRESDNGIDPDAPFLEMFLERVFSFRNGDGVAQGRIDREHAFPLLDDRGGQRREFWIESDDARLERLDSTTQPVTSGLSPAK